MTAPDYLEGVVVEALERATARLLDAAGPRAYTAAEVAERLGVSDDTVYRLINDGRLPRDTPPTETAGIRRGARPVHAGRHMTAAPPPNAETVALMRESLDSHDNDRHDLRDEDDPEVVACVWCQS